MTSPAPCLLIQREINEAIGSMVVLRGTLDRGSESFQRADVSRVVTALEVIERLAHEFRKLEIRAEFALTTSSTP